MRSMTKQKKSQQPDISSPPVDPTDEENIASYGHDAPEDDKNS